MKNQPNAMHDVLQWLCSCNPRAGNNFYGRVLNGCRRTPVKDLGTCAVGLTPDGHYKFLWDATWFEEQHRTFQILVVLHEVAHLVLQHLERILRIRLRIADPKKYAAIHDIANIAADMAANDTVIRPFMCDGYNANQATFQDAAEQLIFPEKRGYPKHETFEYYLARLLEDMKKDGWTPETGGDYPTWFADMVGKTGTSMLDPVINIDASDLTDAEIERIVSNANAESKQMIKGAIEQAQRARGTIPHHLQSWIEEMLAEPKIPWAQVFRGYLKTAISSKLSESSAYPNPALFNLAMTGEIEPYTGYQKEFTFNLAVLIDSSGSIGADEYETFIAELQGLAQAEPGATATLVYFDSSVQHVERLTLDPEQFKSHYRYSYGGTDFNAPFKYILGRDDARTDDSVEERIQQRNWDAVIMLTDGEAPIESPSGPCPDFLPPCPVIWVLVGRRESHPAMGTRIVHLE